MWNGRSFDCTKSCFSLQFLVVCLVELNNNIGGHVMFAVVGYGLLFVFCHSGENSRADWGDGDNSVYFSVRHGVQLVLWPAVNVDRCHWACPLI